jgi:hypothetical protein
MLHIDLEGFAIHWRNDNFIIMEIAYEHDSKTLITDTMDIADDDYEQG